MGAWVLQLDTEGTVHDGQRVGQVLNFAQRSAFVSLKAYRTEYGVPALAVFTYGGPVVGESPL